MHTEHVAPWSGTGQLARPAERIVSLLPSATEIVCALGLAERLVAVTHECDFPPDVVVRLPRVTANRLPDGPMRSGQIDAAVRSALADGHGLYELDVEGLGELRPDLVLTQELCSVCAVAYPAVLGAARVMGGDGDPVVVSLEPRSLDDVLATIQLVAQLGGVSERGSRLVRALRGRVAAIRPPSHPPRVALIEWLDPLFAPGHWVPEQLEAAGGDSVIGRAGEPSREMSWEALAAADPELIVLGLCGFDLQCAVDEWMAFRPPEPLTRMAAWRAGDIWAIDGSAYVSRPGPRVVDGIEMIADLIGRRTESAGLRRLPT